MPEKKSENKEPKQFIYNKWTPADGDYKIDYESTRTYNNMIKRKKALKSGLKAIIAVLLAAAAILLFINFLS